MVIATGGILSSRLSESWLHIAYLPKGPIILAIIVGAGALFVSFLGCCGAIKGEL